MLAGSVAQCFGRRRLADRFSWPVPDLRL